MLPVEINLNSKELIRGVGEFKEYKHQYNPQKFKYVGKIINGKPVFIEDVELPENADIIIMLQPENLTKTNLEEIEKRKAMVNSLKGCLSGYTINLDEIREERIARRGLLE